MQEKVVETKICKHCGVSFDITNKDTEFYEKISPVFQRPVSLEETGLKEGVFKNLGNGKIKYQIPSPTLCPDCRQQRRLSFRNERNLYKRKCDLTKKDIISIYSPDKRYKVYEQNEWWSDKWDPLDYGIDFDFSRSFFEQFGELMKEIPLQNLNNKLLESCNYVNDCISCKGCYLTFNSIHSEDSMYSYILRNGIDCVDTDFCDKCFNSYDLIECGGNSHYLFYSAKSSKCLNSYFLFNCFKCENCICCSNLADKKYYIFNEKYSLESYEKKKNELFKKGFSSLINDYKKLVNKSFTRHMFGYSNENVLGDNIFFSKNCNECYDSNHLEDCKYIYTAMETKNSQDIYLFGNNLELSYESVFVGENSYKIIFSYGCSVNCYNLLYCYNLTGSSNCFGCIGLRNKQYCILNKQYTKEEYEELVPKIIEHMKKTGEWGEFFPSYISPFGYNETVANEYFPLSKDEVLHNRYPEFISGSIMQEIAPKHSIKDTETSSGLFKKGPIFNRSDYESPFPKVEKIIPASKLPDNIALIPDDILNWAIECEVTKKPFKIITQELDFYRKHNLPIPKKHPDQRHLDRIALRNPRKLFDRKCNKCGVEMKTTYSPDRKEIVYCKECYNKEVY
ncbi:MAG: hypothetical protein WC850_05300 [Candidatus Gracilibacteria bacterium]